GPSGSEGAVEQASAGRACGAVRPRGAVHSPGARRRRCWAARQIVLGAEERHSRRRRGPARRQFQELGGAIVVHKLFESFLEHEDEYRACERYWRELIADAAASIGQPDEWRSWIPRHWANGTPMERDGNPIADGRSDRLDRAFRIVQH